MTTRTWPPDWESRKRGDACLFCGSISAPSFYRGRTSEAYLERYAVALGHVIVIFRGRHVADFTSLAPEELAEYSQDIQAVAAIVEHVFRPCHMNYLLMGNVVPHLHVHLVPRYLDDPAPEQPLPWKPAGIAEELFAEQFHRLREAGKTLSK